MSFSWKLWTRLRPASLAAWQALSAAESSAGDVLVVAGDRHHADAAAEPERALLPDELVVADRLAQLLGHAQRLVERAALEQHAELVAAEARERVAPADLGLQQRADLAEQRVAGAVAAGVVDDLELVEVEVAQRVGRLARLGAAQRPLEPLLELAAVDEAGQHVVARVVGELAVQLAALADVVEHQHAARHRARAVADRRGRALDVHLVAVALDQQRRPHRLDRARCAGSRPTAGSPAARRSPRGSRGRSRRCACPALPRSASR